MVLVQQSAGNFLLGEVSVVVELGDGDIVPGGLVELGTNALQQDLGRAIFGAGELGHFLWVDANLGHNGV